MKGKSVILPISLNLLGTIIGAGIFGLPAVFSYTGILGGTILFFAILIMVIILNLLYVDVIFAVRGKHRLPGYALKILGPKAYWVALLGMFGKIAGTALAYIILGGLFLSMIAQGLNYNYPDWIWTVMFWGAGSLVVYYGYNFVTEVESELTWLLIGFILFTVAILFPFFNWRTAHEIIISGFSGAIGVIFFATTAMTVLPDVLDMAGKQRSQARLGVFLAVLFAGIISWAFGISIASVYPNITGVQDIQAAFPEIFWWLIPGVGLLAVITSYITFTQAMQNLLHIDLKIQRVPSWIIAVVMPMLLYVLVSRSFLATIGFVGAVLTAMNGLIVCSCSYRILREPDKKPSSLLEFIKLKPKPDGLMRKIWSYLPIPIAILLLGIMFEHIISLI
ncbi:MAG: aromatic amino acid transport family protein [Patescibacteria group bacterium]